MRIQFWPKKNVIKFLILINSLNDYTLWSRVTHLKENDFLLFNSNIKWKCYLSGYVWSRPSLLNTCLSSLVPLLNESLFFANLAENNKNKMWRKFDFFSFVHRQSHCTLDDDSLVIIKTSIITSKDGGA